MTCFSNWSVCRYRITFLLSQMDKALECLSCWYLIYCPGLEIGWTVWNPGRWQESSRSSSTSNSKTIGKLSLPSENVNVNFVIAPMKVHYELDAAVILWRFLVSWATGQGAALSSLSPDHSQGYETTKHFDWCWRDSEGSYLQTFMCWFSFSSLCC